MAVYEAIKKHGIPKELHIVVIGFKEGVDFIEKKSQKIHIYGLP
jgi:uracil phosphoribosyltransferase